MKTNATRLKKLLISLIAMLTPLLVIAHDFEVDGIYYRLVSSTDKKVSVTYKGESSNSYYNEYYGDVTIPSTITYEGTTYKVMSIEDAAFYNCIGLESINISEGVTSIGNYAFYGCKSLITTIIPNSVENIGNDAFLGCAGELIVNCNIPSGGINTGVFRYCNFSKVTIGSKVTSIGEYAFHGCRNITSITIPEGVVSIGSSAFRECKNLVSITISESVTSIGSMVFGECTSLTSITIPENSKLESIGMSTFSGCNSLTSIIIPKSVTNIEGSIFSSCNNLSSIVIAEGNSTYDSRDNCNAIIKTRINQLISGCSTTIIPKSITSIGSSAFSYCDSLITIFIPEDVTSIKDNAFRGCSNLTTINISENSKLTDIASEAFFKCCSLTSITIPEGVTNIGIGAFNECTSLTSVIIPKSVKSIGQYAFSDCIGEIYVNCNIPSSTNSSKGTFYNCNISKVVIGDEVTSIGSYAFYKCKNLTTIVLPENLSNISSLAFAGCEQLTDVYCYAENVPIAVANTFSESNIEYATLHVPVSALKSYKNIAPWNSFGKLEAMSIAVTSITLSASSATLTEGDTLAITATVLPNNAADKSVIWSSSNSNVATVDNAGKATAIAPGTATITATANDSSGVRASCEVTVTPASYVITYLIDGDVFATDTVVRGTPISMVIEPQKEGYTFSGWGEVPEIMPAHDVTLNATFIPNKYLVTFKIGDEVVAADSLEYKSAIIAPEAPEKEGYTFNGWGEVADSVPANDLTYEGSYTINTYTLVYAVDGEVVLKYPIVYGGAIPRLMEPSKPGYTFSGWSEIPETMPAKDTAISGTFIPNKYLVTFKIGDEVITSDSLEYGAAIVAPEAPKKEGHTFKGWGEIAKTVPSNDMTYKGSYSVNSYTLTYVVDDEIYHQRTVTYGTELDAIMEPSKEGYTFSGWSEMPETMPANDVTITGTFKKFNYVSLTILQADNGCVKQKLVEGTTCTFVIEAAEGWKVNAVTFNGEDVTSKLDEENSFTTPELLKDATLNISYEKIDNEVESTSANVIKVSGHNGIICICGAAEGAAITIYTLNGAMVANAIATAETTSIEVPTHQVYIVMVADKVVKIGM